jgi:hypothetical protein
VDAFINFALCRLEVRAGDNVFRSEDAPAERVFVRKGTELAPYLRDYLAICRMETLLAGQLEEGLAVARQFLAACRNSGGINRARIGEDLCWRFAAYLPLVVYYDESAEDVLALAREAVSLHVQSGETIALASDLTTAAFIQDLRGGAKDDAALSAAVKRVNRVFQRMDWWPAQNFIWRNGAPRPDYRFTSAELGFRI